MRKVKQNNKVIQNKKIFLDIGCGGNKVSPEHIGIDQHKMKGVDIVLNVAKEKLPYKDNSVDQIHCSHFLEHLNAKERCHFLNECYRVLKKGVWDNGQVKEGFISIIVPHCFSSRAYGDPTHAWPPIGEMFFYYLSKGWRETQAPHSDVKWNKDGYSCDFDCRWGYSMRQDLLSRNQEYQQNALLKEKEAAQDIIATCVKL